MLSRWEDMAAMVSTVRSAELLLRDLRVTACAMTVRGSLFALFSTNLQSVLPLVCVRSCFTTGPW